ncbi:MAG: sulfurtransferase [Cyanobacteria bacterium J06581_3]
MTPSSYLVDVQWLAEQVLQPSADQRSEASGVSGDRNLVIIDTRFALSAPTAGYEQYLAGHIPGAYYLDLNQDLSSPVQSHGGRHPLPNWDCFTQKLNQLGIYSAAPNGPTQIVIYDNSRFAFAARLWWMLRYLGHEQAAILDGGIQAWEKAGFPLTKEIPPKQAGDFQPQPQADWVVPIETLRERKHLSEVVMIDSRSPERWRGEVEPIDPIAGSVPGSINSFWKNISTEAGNLKPVGELIKHWSSLSPDDEIIVYCGSGVTACVNLFSLVMAGHPMHKLYPGGWSDWCSYLTE